MWEEQEHNMLSWLSPYVGKMETIIIALNVLGNGSKQNDFSLQGLAVFSNKFVNVIYFLIFTMRLNNYFYSNNVNDITIKFWPCI